MIAALLLGAAWSVLLTAGIARRRIRLSLAYSLRELHDAIGDAGAVPGADDVERDQPTAGPVGEKPRSERRGLLGRKRDHAPLRDPWGRALGLPRSE